MDWPLTLLDRLLPGPFLSPKERMVRDLERLLNTRAPWRPDLTDPTVALADYGLPQIAGEMLDTPERIAALCHLIERKIERFDPRLVGVKVRSVGTSGGRVHLRIEATLAPTTPSLCVAEAVLWPDGQFGLDAMIEEIN